MPKFHARPSLVASLLFAATIGAVMWRGAAPESRPAARTHAIARSESTLIGARAAVAPPVAPAVSARPLFAYATTHDAPALDAALPAPAREIAYVRVDRDLTAGKRSPFWQSTGTGRIAVPLPRGGSVVVVIEDSEMLGAARFVSRGRIEGRAGSAARFAWNEGFLHAEIEDPVIGKFALRAATDELAQFYRVDPALVLPCGGEHVPSRSAAPTVLNVPVPAIAPPSAATGDNPQPAEVHLMMLYTQAVLPTLAGAARVAALQSAFDLAVVRVNDVLAASLVSARVKLVRIAETSYDESASAGNRVQDDALTALTETDDAKMDEIHALRDAAGADLVCLALARRDFASSGLSFVLGGIDDPANERFAFSVVEYGQIAGSTVLAHELGHLFGCAHDRQNSDGAGGAYSFSYGYRFTGADGRQYRDIMAYPPGTELGYFSNPAVIAPAPASVALGVAAGLAGESNNALTIERTAFAAAAYRLQTQTPAAAGTLINVATRAFVGTGDNVMIAGLVVRGAESKPILLRAAGPALRAFGVGDALADPVLRIFSGATVIADNDNWSGAAVVTATARAGAFPFVPGSADAAVLTTLAPGAYTAIVEGAGGVTGSGLVEAFEIEAGAARIVNLSTRGFAARGGREMIGGFVVQGQPGTTKRILIRVLGPTLSRAPFNLTGVLDDPEMEVRNSHGEPVLHGDDWSAGATGGASPVNDFSPIVEFYSEKQIAATGFAPANRREPCVLVDLPPGAYTVIVRPFELRDPDSSRDQPAKPGVGLIEVFEIAP